MIVALILVGIIGVIQPDAPVLKVLEFVVIGGVAFFLGFRSGKGNGVAAKNGS